MCNVLETLTDAEKVPIMIRETVNVMYHNRSSMHEYTLVNNIHSEKDSADDELPTVYQYHTFTMNNQQHNR